MAGLFRSCSCVSRFRGVMSRWGSGALLLAVAACASPVDLPAITPIASDQIIDATSVRPPMDITTTAPDQPLPSRPVSMPAAGEENAYGIRVSAPLAKAYRAYLAHDGRTALALVHAAAREPGAASDPVLAWHLVTFKAQILIMMGRALDAEPVLDGAAAMERRAFGTDINAWALQGEAKLWNGAHDAAIYHFARVADQVGDWRLPTSYMAPPSNLPELVARTTAQLRAYTGLAGAYLLKGNAVAALPWAEAAEVRFNDVHYVADHPLYGQFVAVHGDSYYGRAMNLTFLGAARLLTERDPKAGDAPFAAAKAYFNAIGYQAGALVTDALKSWALLELGAREAALALAARTATAAARANLPDLVWRVQAVRGEALLALGRDKEAEAAFRQADAAVALVSGGLASDRAKRRFGVGKEDIIYRLVGFALDRLKTGRRGGTIAPKAADELFTLLERSRARAFVDMLADRAIASGSRLDLVTRLRGLDRQILRSRLKRWAPLAPAGSTGAGSAPDPDAPQESALLAQRASLLEVLRVQDPELAAALSVATHRLSNVQKRLPEGTVMAYALPVRGSDPLRLLLIDRKRVRLHLPGASAETLWSALASFRRAVEAGDKEAEILEAKSLSALLRPSRWGARKRLYVVPSGDWYFVPWGVLDLDVPVAVLPTGGWLLRHGTRQRFAIARSQTEGEPAAAVVVGDPDFGGTLPQLPAARSEAKEVAGAYGTLPLIGPAATEQALRERSATGTRVLHLATHGRFDAGDPLASAVYLALPEEEQKAAAEAEAAAEAAARAVARAHVLGAPVEEAAAGASHRPTRTTFTTGPDALTAAELFENPIPAELVVLSACETGLGEVEAGDDFLGLARSFYLGGSRAVLHSLWPVSDEGTRIFMEAFHARARKDGDFGRAWIAGRKAARQADLPPSVYGAFVLGGAMR